MPIFNPWRKYPNIRPKKDGRYLVTVRELEYDNYPYVKISTYRVEKNSWVDRYVEDFTEDQDVVGWKKIPRTAWFKRPNKVRNRE